MFWLLSLLMPSHRRQAGERRFDNLSALITSPESRGALLKIVGIIAAVAVVWLIVAAILSLFNAWFVVALAAVLAMVVYTKEWHQRRREEWIQEGCCANCGYDLRATPDRCPECGRDARLDEPIWRRMRRELEAKLLADASAPTIENQPALPCPPEGKDAQKPAEEQSADVLPAVRIVTRNPEADDTTIPLEGEN